MPQAAEQPFGNSSRAVVVLDSGGGYVRVGYSKATRPAASEPNCTATPKNHSGKAPLVGADAIGLPACTLHRPVRRGLLLDAEQQRCIWDTILRKRLGLAMRDCAILVTETPCTPASVRRETEEVLSDTFGFQHVRTLPGPPLALRSPRLQKQLDPQNPCCTVLSMGFSGCVATPCIDGHLVHRAVRRLNVGARVLTNILLERLSLRHYDLRESWLVAEDVFGKLCEVSLDFDEDLRTGFERVQRKTYVLPDFKTRNTGFVEDPAEEAPLEQPEKSGAQRITLGAERVVVPEALFRPQDQGVGQAGIAELVQQAILAVEPSPWRMHLGQVALCGGLARLPGLQQRLQQELRQLLPSSWRVRVLVEEEPELSVWRGAARAALSGELGGVSGPANSGERRRGGVKRSLEEDLPTP